VAKARYGEPAAAEYITGVLIKRRDKAIRIWLTGVNPIVDPRLSATGTLTFDNAAVAAGVAAAPTAYVLASSAGHPEPITEPLWSILTNQLLHLGGP
jgi:hypothetical protein